MFGQRSSLVNRVRARPAALRRVRIGMGASVWHYFVKYERDIEHAFSRLQRDVFRRGAYHIPRALSAAERKRRIPAAEAELAKLYGPEYDDADRETLVPIYEEEIRKLRNYVKPRRPKRMTDLPLDEDGTHSILDMKSVSRARGRFGRVSPIPRARLRELFRTDKPQRKQVEARLDELGDDYRRWTGWYVIIYSAKGTPTEILFGGSSGD